MAGRIDEADKKIEENRLKVKLHWETNGRVWIDQACITACWSIITPYINISTLYPHLVSHNLATSGGNDYYKLLNQPPAEAKQQLLELVSTAGHYGPYLLYMCFLASCSGCLGHSYTAKDLRKEALKRRPQPPYEICGDPAALERDGQEANQEDARRMEGSIGGIGGGGEGERGRGGIEDYEQFSSTVVAHAQSSPEGSQSMVVPTRQQVEKQMEALSLTSGHSSMSYQSSLLGQPLSRDASFGSIDQSFDADVEKDKPEKPSPSSTRQNPPPHSRRDPPSLARAASLPSCGAVSTDSGVCSSSSFSSFQSHHGVIEEESNQAEGQSVVSLLREHIIHAEYSAAINFHQDGYDISFARQAECSSSDSFLTCVHRFVTASLNSRHEFSCSVLVAGIDEDTEKPFALNVNAHDLSARFAANIQRTIYCRESLDGNEVRLSPELAEQVSLSFVTPQPGRKSKQEFQHASPVAIVTVRPNPSLCGCALFTWRHIPTERGKVWRRLGGHCVDVERIKEMKELYDKLRIYFNNSAPPKQ